ncbi:hypothetical protein [Paenibacillus turpanensis]|uniref:hypothetical protein n=1 Tax=Paenibacillus turpanensis TaxID=2689078 RepID=UPI001408DD58|nr:hypothetical protein [Paenibacillus turpanensis]
MQITDEQLDEFRIQGLKVRVIRDANPANDVLGYVVAWDDSTVMVRKQNRKIVKLDRGYRYQEAALEREIDT